MGDKCLILCFFIILFSILGLDDPLDAVAVHFGGGILGVLCVPFFKHSTGIFWIVKNMNDPNFDFESEDYEDPGRILGVNIAGLLVIIAWSAFWSTFVFGGLQYFNNLRVDSETETKGNDIVRILNVKGVQIVYRLFLVNCYLLHAPRLPSQPASNMGGWLID